MRKLLSIFLLLFSVASFGQSESHNFTTYDTVYYESGGGRWTIRITRPVNMFTTNNPDTASRPAIIFMPGQGEAVNDQAQQNANARKYGPHYWLDNGWDGGVTISNGKHYPILITIVPSYVNPRAPAFTGVINHLLNTYHIKRNSVHGTGFSMGAFTWSKSMVYEASAGAETFMKLVTSLCLLQGSSNETFAPYNAWTRGWGAFGRWAKIYNGKFFGLEGTSDTRNVWLPRNSMRDSGYVANAYFAWENIGSPPGDHCCWNDMYSPYRTNWSATAPLGPNITTNNNAGKDNTQGTYKPGDNIFTWMIRQGDTTLVGGAPGSPLASAGGNQTINLPITTANLTGTNLGTAATSTTWTQTGGTTATITTPNSLTTSVTGLTTVGVRTFRLTLTNAQGTSTSDVSVSVMGGVNTDPTVDAGENQSLTLPTTSTSVTAIASDVDGTIVSYQWTSSTVGVTFGSATSATTTVNNLPVGTTTLTILVTDDDGATAFDQVFITVVDPEQVIPKRVKVRIYAGVGNAIPDFVNVNSNNQPSVNIVGANDDGTPSSIRISLTNSNQIYDNGASYPAWNSSSVGPIWPTEVLRRDSYYAGNRTMTITGMQPNRPYNLYFLSSRASGNSSTVFTIQGNSQPAVPSFNNNSLTATFTGYTTPDGTMEVFISRVGTYSHLNGFIIEEQGAAGPSNNQPSVQMPTVNPIQLPTSSVSLTAIATDEDQSGLTYLWSVLSGPSSYTFSAPTSLTTNFSGLTQGTYVVQFAATDTRGLTGLGNVTIVVNPAGNTLPTVSAGSDQTVTINPPATSASTQLLGTASDPDGTITAYQWSFISGPTGSTLFNATSATATVSGLVVGQYFFRLQATDNNGGSRADTVSITTQNPTPVNPINKIVGAGEYQAYFIDSTKHAWSIGNVTNGGSGNVGQGAVTRKLTRAAATTLFDTAVGALHGGAFIDVNGYVWTVGDNDQAQMGIGNFTHPIYTAQQILIDSLGNPFNNVTQIVGGYLYETQSNYFMGIKDGDLYVWGKVLGGLMGNGIDSVTYFCTRPYKINMPGNRKVKQIAAGNTPIALCTDGTVWTWGIVGNFDRYDNLGYIPTNKFTDYRTPHQLTFGSLTDPVVYVTGGGGWNYALFGNGTLYGWGSGGNYMGDLVFPTGGGTRYTTPRQLTNITNNLPSKIVKIVVNYTCTYALLENKWLMGWGDNALSGLGNGGSLDWANTTPPWAWNGVGGQLLVKQPVRLGPNSLFADIYTSNVYCFYYYAIDVNNQLYFAGRGKGSVGATGVALCSSTMEAVRQDANDQKWLDPVWPFGISTQYLVTSPDCVFGPTVGSPCTTCTTPSTTKPTANAGPNQTIPRNFTTLNGLASVSPTGTIIGYKEWKQVSGPSTALIDFPASFTPQITNLVDGVYVFRFVTEATNRQKDSATVTITVGQVFNNPPNVFAGGSVVTQLPKDSVNLVAIASDIEGPISSYAWSLVSAPVTGGGTLTGANTANAKAKNLKEGTYVYNVTVTDSGGLSASSQVNVIVSAAVIPPPEPNPVPNSPRKYFKLRY